MLLPLFIPTILKSQIILATWLALRSTSYTWLALFFWIFSYIYFSFLKANLLSNQQYIDTDKILYSGDWIARFQIKTDLLKYMEIKLRVEIIFMITDKIALPSVQFPSVVSIMLGVTYLQRLCIIDKFLWQKT